ncbi:hypothetical protein CsSME_00009883 [Camellia sinensis var. sinensis]
MELNTIKDAFDRVAKKQKLSTSKSQEVIDQVGHELDQALTNIQSIQDPTSPADQKSILMELKAKLNAIGPHNQLEGSQKELNINLSKYPKILEKTFNPDISKAYRNVDFDPHIVNHIIASHFYRVGLFDVADTLINEAGEPEVISLKSHFMELHQILEAVSVRNLEPALYWVSTNRESLKHIGSNLELKLRRLQFVEILQNRLTSLLLLPYTWMRSRSSWVVSCGQESLTDRLILSCCLLPIGKHWLKSWPGSSVVFWGSPMRAR